MERERETERERDARREGREKARGREPHGRKKDVLERHPDGRLTI